MLNCRPLLGLSLALCAVLPKGSYAALPLVEFRGASQGCINQYGHIVVARRDWPAHSTEWKRDSFFWEYCVFLELDPSRSHTLRLLGSNEFNDVSGTGSAQYAITIARWLPTSGGSYNGSLPSGTAEARISLDLQSVSDGEKDEVFLVSRSNVGTRNGAWLALDDSTFVSTSARTQQNSGTKSEIYYSVSRDLRGSRSIPDFDETIQFSYQVLHPRYCTSEERSADVSKFSSAPENTLEFIKKLVCVGLIPSGANGANGDWANRRSRLLPLVHRLEEMIVLAAPGPVRDLLMTKVRGFFRWASSTMSNDLSRQASVLRDLSRMLDDARNPYSIRNLLEVLKSGIANSEQHNQSVGQLLEVLSERREISDNSDFLEFISGIESVLNEPNMITQEQVQRLIEVTRVQAQRLQAESIELIRERDEYIAKGTVRSE